MTANAMKADLDECLAAGMNDYVIKPIDRQALLHTVRRWLPAGADVATSRPLPTCRLRRRSPHHATLDGWMSQARCVGSASTSTRCVACSCGLPTDRRQPSRRCARLSRPGDAGGCRQPRTCDCRGGREPRRRRLVARRPRPSSTPLERGARTWRRCWPRWNGRRSGLSIDRHVARRRPPAPVATPGRRTRL